MTLKSNIQATGASYGHSQAVCGEIGPYVTAAGSTQATATLLPKLARHYVNAGTGGVIINPGIGSGDPLQDGDETEISNAIGSDLIVYPPLGVAFSGSATNAPITVATGYSVSVLILSSTLFMPRYYATASGAGSVNSVALTAPAEINVAGSPITSSGTLALTWANESANIVFAGPTSGGATTPAFRSLVTNDLPNTAVTPGSYTYTALTVDAKGRITAASNGAAPSGTVTSVAMSVPNILSVAGSPITTTGTLAVTLATQTANLVFASATSGGAATPAFRSLVAADIPSNLKQADISFIIDGGGSAITTGIKGDLQINFDCTIQANTVLLDQSGSIVVDIWKDTYANYPPVVGDSITASAKPTVTATTKSTDSTLTGWTTSITAGNTLRFNVDSITTATRALINLKVVKT